jgi:peptide/nickel transport system ATP-binding protein
MHLGRIVETGPTASVLRQPRHPYTQRLLAAVPVADPTAPRQPPRLDASELASPIRDIGYAPAAGRWDDFGGGHRVWTDAAK